MDDVDFTQVFFTDLNGRLMTLQVNRQDIDSFTEKGIGFDSSSVSGMGTVEDSDQLLMPIPETYRILKFKNEKLGFYIGKVNHKKGTRSEYDCRQVLERVLDKARKEHGYNFLAGPEHEFFLLKGDVFNKNIHTDSARYFHADPCDKGESVRKKIIEVLKGCGIKFEKAHHEVTASQHEINLEAVDPLTAADRTLLFTYVTKKIAQSNGFHATFMPKPFDGQNRNAFHIHVSMQDEDGLNVFYDAKAKYGLSRQARQFIGGLIKYSRQTSIVMASIYNSYKAYVADREAPIVRGWGIKNRSSMVRLPYTNNPDTTRIELRNPDPAGNAYLQMAALIGMGLAGLREGLDCGQPDMGSAYKNNIRKKVLDDKYLPTCMFEALMEAEDSEFLEKLFGKRLYDRYMKLKRDEWEEYRVHVTSLEHSRYLSV